MMAANDCVHTSAHTCIALRPFSVTVKTPSQRVTLTVIGRTSSDVHAAQLERFGGLCSVVVIPAQVKP